MYGLCLGSASRFETAEATPTAKRFSSTQVMVSTVLCGVGASNSFRHLVFLLKARHIIVRSTEALQIDQQGLVFMPDR